MPAIIPLTTVIERIKRTWGTDVTIDTNTYVSYTKLAKFIDVTHGEWWAWPRRVIDGVGHPRTTFLKKSKAKRRSVESVVAELHIKHHGILTLDTSTYVHTNISALFIDRDYGSWWAKPYNILSGMSHPTRGQDKLRTFTISRRLHVEEALKRLAITHGNQVTLDVSTYIDLHTKARFIDVEYGEWWATPANVIHKTGHPDRSMKAGHKTRAKLPLVAHWKTSEELYSQSSWEYATLLWLNKHHYDFRWQIPIRTSILTPKNKASMYYVDLQITSGPMANTFVEIKGTWKVRGKPGAVLPRQKWDWFHTNYPNSELWMQPELEKLGILKNGRPHPDLLRS